LLEEQLAGVESDKPTPVDALHLARRTYVRGERIDMGALASELGISRVTLNRWVGTREDLTGEVSWDIMRRTLDSCASQVRATGGERIVQIIVGSAEAATAHPGAQAFMTREPELAVQVNTSFRGRVAPRFETYLRELLYEEHDAGRIEMDVDLGEVAYAIVQITTSFFWRPYITGEPVNLNSLEAVLRLLLCGSSSRRTMATSRLTG
jgi:hypothetical protein